MTMAHHGSWLMGWLCQCFSRVREKCWNNFLFVVSCLLCPFAIAYPPANACHYSQHTAHSRAQDVDDAEDWAREREKTNSSHFSRLFCSSSRCLRALAWHGSAMCYGSMHTSTGKCLTFSLAGIKRFQHAVPLFSYFCFDRLECSTPLSTKHKQNRRNTSSATTTSTEHDDDRKPLNGRMMQSEASMTAVAISLRNIWRGSFHFDLMRCDATRVQNVFKH